MCALKTEILQAVFFFFFVLFFGGGVAGVWENLVCKLNRKNKYKKGIFFSHEDMDDSSLQEKGDRKHGESKLLSFFFN